MLQPKARITTPRSSLGNLAARSGGLSREAALQQAAQELEAQGDEAAKEIDAQLVAIGEIVRLVADGHIAGGPLIALTQRADTIVTIAGTFGLTHIEEAAKSLCHVLARADRLPALCIEPIRAHVDAMCLLSHSHLTNKDATMLLGELAKTVRTA